MSEAVWVLIVCIALSSGTQELSFSDSKEWLEYYGVGALSGGGATSTFLEAYPEPQRAEILDWMFKPGYGASLNILKVEIGSDDQTTDGCEGCHMRAPNDLNCHRGYEWEIMKQAVARSPDITLYGLPWGWPGWLGFGSTNPFANVTATADYVARWLECAKSAHGLNVSMVGLWNEADSFWSQELHTFDYILALRHRLDSSGFGHVRIVAPDGSIAAAVQTMQANASIKAATWALGQHYPGASGTSPEERALGMPLLASEDYSTYSDATGAACWARLLTQNLGWGYSATVSWYLLGAFARGMDYDSDGLIRAEWPSSGHFELTPMLWTTMHFTRFSSAGWRIMPCPDAQQPPHPTGRCALPGGGNYALLLSPESTDFTIVAHAYDHNHSGCIRNDPPAWEVPPTQTIEFQINRTEPAPGALVQVRSCSSWRYPSHQDGYFSMLEDVPVSKQPGGFSFAVTIEANCFYTFSTIRNVTKPPVPASAPPAQAFPLPYSDQFDGVLVGAEAAYFGDQMGKFEVVEALGRPGRAMQQQLGQAAWPINHPSCDHSQPISIIGDMYMQDLRVSAEVLLPSSNLGAGLAVRTRNPSSFWRGVAPGLYLFVGATIGVAPSQSREAPGGVPAPPNVPIPGWQLCSDSYCQGPPVASGALPTAWEVGAWHRLSLSVLGDVAVGVMDHQQLFEVSLSNTTHHSAANHPAPPFNGKVPSSGWAALVSTLGPVQFDDFLLEGLNQGGAAVAPCSSGVTPGAVASLTACDVAQAKQWQLTQGGHLQLRDSALCLGVGSANTVNLLDCDSSVGLLAHNQSTGQIQSGAQCVDVAQRLRENSIWPGVVLAGCASLPSSTQQYQYNPQSMVLRPKSGQCVPDFPGATNDAYRDCCVAVC